MYFVLYGTPVFDMECHNHVFYGQVYYQAFASKKTNIVRISQLRYI